MLPREILMQFVESGTVFTQTFIVSLKPLYYLFTCKIEFSAYPRRGKCPPPPPLERNPELHVFSYNLGLIALMNGIP